MPQPRMPETAQMQMPERSLKPEKETKVAKIDLHLKSEETYQNYCGEETQGTQLKDIHMIHTDLVSNTGSN